MVVGGALIVVGIVGLGFKATSVRQNAVVSGHMKSTERNLIISSLEIRHT